MAAPFRSPNKRVAKKPKSQPQDAAEAELWCHEESFPSTESVRSTRRHTARKPPQAPAPQWEPLFEADTLFTREWGAPITQKELHIRWQSASEQDRNCVAALWGEWDAFVRLADARGVLSDPQDTVSAEEAKMSFMGYLEERATNLALAGLRLQTYIALDASYSRTCWQSGEWRLRFFICMLSFLSKLFWDYEIQARHATLLYHELQGMSRAPCPLQHRLHFAPRGKGKDVACCGHHAAFRRDTTQFACALGFVGMEFDAFSPHAVLVFCRRPMAPPDEWTQAQAATFLTHWSHTLRPPKLNVHIRLDRFLSPFDSAQGKSWQILLARILEDVPSLRKP